MLSIKEKLSLFFIKIFRFEFWPYYILYFPALFYGLILAVKAKSLVYFSATNPTMKYGGAFGMSKTEILNSLSTDYKPITILIKHPYTIISIEEKLKQHNLNYPFIFKPDIGERGVQVEKINSRKELESYLLNNNENIILQEYVDFKNELGVLYFRFPNENKGHITSIVVRNFLKIEGDGILTMKELMKKNLRALMRFDHLVVKFADKLNSVLPKGENMLLEPIGNHNRGTAFLNGNHLINEKLVNVFDEIANDLKGFYYGRFDLKYLSLQDLYEGKNIKILEINGVNSEPAHIYNPHYSLFKAYKSIFKHVKIIYLISRINHKNGIEYGSFIKFFNDMLLHTKRNI